ncbi:MAG: peptidylprolyl isomerase [Gammaproteobacteria bacterium]|nr:peptidylprolyl isomerase [Gammaproteobacteria bacterium]MCP5137279.1 peptidylprolyl isomerase [Gammaproteobacteria bacterium]
MTVTGHTELEQKRFALHLGLAEQGKIHAVEDRHQEALTHYREAMNVAVRQGAPEVFFRHYLGCSLESLERMGAYQEVLDYCEKALAHYQENPPEHDIARLDRATIRQREGVIAMRLGEVDRAKTAFAEALNEARALRARLPLAERLNRWLLTNMHIDPRRLEQELAQHDYWTVRPDNIDRGRARALPEVPASSSPNPMFRR